MFNCCADDARHAHARANGSRQDECAHVSASTRLPNPDRGNACDADRRANARECERFSDEYANARASSSIHLAKEEHFQVQPA